MLDKFRVITPRPLLLLWPLVCLFGNPSPGIAYHPPFDHPTVSAPFDFSKIADKVIPSVVTIHGEKVVASLQRGGEDLDPTDRFFDQFYGTPGTRPPGFRHPPRMGSGSGIVVAGGLIVTNHHVVEGATKINVTFQDQRIFEAKLLGSDPNTDLAVLSIEATNLPSLPFGDSDAAQVGEWVMAVGSPFHLNSTVTVGIISAKGRNLNISRNRYAVESFIQTDAVINPGNSGGPLVNSRGEVVGVNTAILTSPSGAYTGYGFAVPSNIVKKVVADIAEFGEVRRGFLGISIRDLNAAVAKEKGIDLLQGVYVQDVAAQSGAREAGIRQGDVILDIQGKATLTSAQLQELTAMHRPGDKVVLTVHRNGKEFELEVVLKGKEAPSGYGAAENALDLDSLNLGADFSELDMEKAQEYGVLGGVVVERVFEGRLVELGVGPGFVITHVDKRVVTGLEDLRKAFSGKGGYLFVVSTRTLRSLIITRSTLGVSIALAHGISDPQPPWSALRGRSHPWPYDAVRMPIAIE